MLRPQVSKHAVLHYSSSCLHSIATHSLHCLSELMNDTKEREMFRCSLQLHLFPSAIHTPTHPTPSRLQLPTLFALELLSGA